MISDLLYKEQVFQIQGAIFEVYRILGPGFKELVYQKALEREFEERAIKFEKEKSLKIEYKGKLVGFYKADFIIEDKIILEIKAVPEMPTYFETQLFYYLKATNYKLGLLVNFGAEGKIDIRRRIFDTVRRK